MLLPAANEKDLKELPAALRGELELLLVRTIEEALPLALLPLPEASADACKDDGKEGGKEAHKAAAEEQQQQQQRRQQQQNHQHTGRTQPDAPVAPHQGVLASRL